MVFVGPTPDHRCTQTYIPAQWENLTESQQETLTYPWEEDGDKLEMSSCLVYDVNDTDWTQGDYNQWVTLNRTSLNCQQGWDYSTEYYETTIVAEVRICHSERSCFEKWPCKHN